MVGAVIGGPADHLALHHDQLAAGLDHLGLGDDLVADQPVRPDATGVGHEHARLPGDVRTQVPGVGPPHQRQCGVVVSVLHPAGDAVDDRA